MIKNRQKEKVHLIGIAGSGMSALAVLLKEAGFRVSGSDENVFEPIAGYLRRNKISLQNNHRPQNIPPDVKLVIIGKHTGLAAEENMETRAALRRKLVIKSLPEMLAILSAKKENLVVVGSFGKSTMTALLAWCLHYAKRHPSYFIGALPLDLKNSSHLGTGKEFVLEGDEYPSANWDKSSKFLHYSPNAVILISAEHDHVNIFPTEKAYVAPYKKLVSKIPKDGFLVYALHGKNNKEVIKFAKCKKISYSSEAPARQSPGVGGDWYAQDIKHSKITSFELCRNRKKIIKIETKLLGRHNIENIVGAAALLLESKKMTPQTFARAVKNFHGIQRRIELLNPKGQVPVYDVFGSSYEKARAGLEALRLHFPGKKIVAVFEPHAFSWRNKKFLHWYKDIFRGVSKVIMLPAMSRGPRGPGEIGTREIWREAKKHFPIQTAKTEKEALASLLKIIHKNDVVALISSGPMLGLTKTLPRKLV